MINGRIPLILFWTDFLSDPLAILASQVVVGHVRQRHILKIWNNHKKKYLIIDEGQILMKTNLTWSWTRKHHKNTSSFCWWHLQVLPHNHDHVLDAGECKITVPLTCHKVQNWRFSLENNWFYNKNNLTIFSKINLKDEYSIKIKTQMCTTTNTLLKLKLKRFKHIPYLLQRLS